jgi:hypothetical protein
VRLAGIALDAFYMIRRMGHDQLCSRCHPWRSS